MKSFFEAFKCLALDIFCIYKLILVPENIKINSKTKLGFGRISVDPDGPTGSKILSVRAIFCRPRADGFGDLWHQQKNPFFQTSLRYAKVASPKRLGIQAMSLDFIFYCLYTRAGKLSLNYRSLLSLKVNKLNYSLIWLYCIPGNPVNTNCFGACFIAIVTKYSYKTIN